MFERPSRCDWSEVHWIRNRLQKGLELLVLGYRYARAGKANVQDFAIGYHSLREVGLEECDIRWLVSQSLVEHYVETTLPGDTTRSFSAGGVAICENSCLTLTHKGVCFVGEMDSVAPTESANPQSTQHQSTQHQSTQHPPEQHSPTQHPRWDTDRQELWYLNQLVKRYRLPSPNQSAILSAFQEERWPARIDDPLPPKVEQDPKRRLHDTIRNLNRSHRRPLLRFVGDGSGQGVLWEAIN